KNNHSSLIWLAVPRASAGTWREISEAVPPYDRVGKAGLVPRMVGEEAGAGAGEGQGERGGERASCAKARSSVARSGSSASGRLLTDDRESDLNATERGGEREGE